MEHNKFDPDDKAYPNAIAKPTNGKPLKNETLKQLVEPFAEKSRAQCYFGPSGVGDGAARYLHNSQGFASSLARQHGLQLELRTMPIDMSADLDDIERLWLAGLQIHHLLDAGERIGPSDFPAPWDVLANAMENVFIEGTHEEGYAKVQVLLHEAQEARQWSIRFRTLRRLEHL